MSFSVVGTVTEPGQPIADPCCRFELGGRDRRPVRLEEGRPPLADWSGGVPGFGDGGTDLLQIKRGWVVLDHCACGVKVDQGCRHALALVECLLDEGNARATVHALHPDLGYGNPSTGCLRGS